MQAGNIPGNRAFAKPDSGLRRETGDFAALLLMLAASASSIAVPAAMRVAMPRVNHVGRLNRCAIVCSSVTDC